MKRMLVFVLFLVSIRGLSASEVFIQEWLFSGSFPVQLPAFSDTENMDGKTFGEENLFRFSWLDQNALDPRPGKAVQWTKQEASEWRELPCSEGQFLRIDVPDERGDHLIAYLAAWVRTDRWAKVHVEMQSRQRLEVFLSDQRIGTKATAEKPDKDHGTWGKEIALEPGTHLLLVRTFLSSSDESPWELLARIKMPDYMDSENISIATVPLRTKTILDITEGERAGNIQLSHDGTYYSVSRSIAHPENKSESWTEIRQVQNNRMVRSFRHASISSFEWGPAGNLFAYRTSRDSKASIWVSGVDNPYDREVMSGVENLAGFRWSPNADYLIYSTREQPSVKTGNMNIILGMQDRMPGFRSRSFLYRLDLKTGLNEPLTHGFFSTSLQDISPDGTKILFSQSRPNYTESPFSLQNMFIMDLVTRKVDTLWKDNPWGGSCSFSPDGKQLLVSAGPSAFGGIGENVPEGKIANSYDGQLYIYKLADGTVEPITRDFDPSVNSSFWHPVDKLIYLHVVEEDYQRIYRYHPRNRRFQVISAGLDLVSSVNFSAGESLAVCQGNNISSPPVAVLINLKDLKYRTLLEPEKEKYRDVQFGKTGDWNFTSSAGMEIKGRVYYPPDFDPSRKYPVIVNYYAGTTPVGRTFASRYPQNTYAAAGYLVYVLQPSGATGFGQAFSAEHVNNWGITVADEIIEGTQKFLAAHPFADASKVGCIGASYGGFMTMLLQTRTDLFAAAISHAGISSISSYWGEGYWGFGYSAAASTGSYPWNNRQLYVDQSPLFSADKIVTPLLLLHGDQDTNVPLGESIQMYVALKILGKPVEFIQVKGENHTILTPTKRREWHYTIMAWFDKHLKDQGEWWDELYLVRNL